MAFRVQYQPVGAIASAATQIGQGKRMAEYQDAQRQSNERAADRMFRAFESAQNRQHDLLRMGMGASLEQQRDAREFGQQKEMFGLSAERAKENMTFQAGLSQQAAEAAMVRNKNMAEWEAGLREQVNRAKYTFEDEQEEKRIARDRAGLKKALDDGLLRPDEFAQMDALAGVRDANLRRSVEERLPQVQPRFQDLRPDQQPGAGVWKDQYGNEFITDRSGTPKPYTNPQKQAEFEAGLKERESQVKVQAERRKFALDVIDDLMSEVTEGENPQRKYNDDQVREMARKKLSLLDEILAGGAGGEGQASLQPQEDGPAARTIMGMPANDAARGIPQLQNPSDIARLPSGTVFIGPDGKRYAKP